MPLFTFQQTTLPLDATWHMPNSPRSALAEYLNGPRIPNALRFDVDEVAELSVDKNPMSLTHMLPSAERFKKELGKHPHFAVSRSMSLIGLKRSSELTRILMSFCTTPLVFSHLLEHCIRLKVRSYRIYILHVRHRES